MNIFTYKEIRLEDVRAHFWYWKLHMCDSKLTQSTIFSFSWKITKPK